MKKSTIIMLVVAIVAVAGTQFGGDRRGDIADLSYPINKLTPLHSRYPPRHSRPRGIRIAGEVRMKKPIVLPLIIALCTLLSGCIIDDGYHPHRHHHHHHYHDDD